MIDRIGSRGSVRVLTARACACVPWHGDGGCALCFSEGLGIILGALVGRCRVTDEAGGHRRGRGAEAEGGVTRGKAPKPRRAGRLQKPVLPGVCGGRSPAQPLG